MADFEQVLGQRGPLMQEGPRVLKSFEAGVAARARGCVRTQG